MIMLGLGHQQRRLLGAGAAIDPPRKAGPIGRTLGYGNYCLAPPHPKPKPHLQTYPRQCRCRHRRFHRHLTREQQEQQEQEQQLGGFQSVQENTQSLRSAQGPLQQLLLLLLTLTPAGEAMQGLEPPAGAEKWHRRGASSWLVLGLTCFCQGHYWDQDQDQDTYVSLGWLIPLRSPSRWLTHRHKHSLQLPLSKLKLMPGDMSCSPKRKREQPRH